ncbi:MAG: antitoxin of toxin-antitoxin stability system [Moraxellaceae bacterium]|nr:MAG: antitoxin of toxin-antitoxin stability system [Moraxellaceae bacterium]
MNTQAIFAEKTVSVTELRKNPSKYFIEEPVAVLSNNSTAGYVVGKELFESMMLLIEAQTPTVLSAFRPNKNRLASIAEQGAALLLAATDDEPTDFVEYTDLHDSND